jgi:hypothetical protein
LVDGVRLPDLVAVLGAVIYLVFTLVTGWRTGAPGPRPDPPPSDPLEIAGRRCVAGEITRDEYQQLRDDLTTHPHQPPPPAEHEQPARSPVPDEAPPAR